MGRWIVRLITHATAALIGFAAGVYLLPVLTAPPAPSERAVQAVSVEASFSDTFQRDLEGSGWLHWGEGTVWINLKRIAFLGRLAPGPDYRLYLTPEFVRIEEEFERVRAWAVRIGDVRTFENFMAVVPETIDVSRFNSVVVWCESFNEFIGAAQYQ